MYVSSPPDDKTESGVANHKLRFKIGPLAWACFAALDALDQLVDRMAADTLHREHDGSQRRVEHSGIHRIIDVVNGVLFLATPGISRDSFSIRSHDTIHSSATTAQIASSGAPLPSGSACQCGPEKKRSRPSFRQAFRSGQCVPDGFHPDGTRAIPMGGGSRFSGIRACPVEAGGSKEMPGNPEHAGGFEYPWVALFFPSCRKHVFPNPAPRFGRSETGSGTENTDHSSNAPYVSSMYRPMSYTVR